MTALQAQKNIEESKLQRSSGVGRLSVIRLDGETRLKSLYQQGNAKLRIPRCRAANTAEAVMINTAGGMTGGDDLSWEFDAGPGTALSLTTQASEKVYRSLGGTAVTAVTVNAAEGSRLSWLPQETILFNRCRFQRTITAHLSSGSQALFVEPMVFGRAAMDENVTGGSIRDRWRICLDGTLLHAEDFSIDGNIAGSLKSAAIANGADAFATVLLISPEAEAFVEDARRIVGHTGGASAWGGKLLIRLISANGYELRKKLSPIIELLDPQTAVPKLWTL